ncbi:ATP-binding protein [Bacillus sp. FJAT-44742]|uniref:ATP-binding protein n=1 Tax=Bacillus sp. FJAT-44742 TaxID=2014005 RepID=UPI000C240317|nr:ATP-binding protein [Bacillus sp. FJAT-44742]
MENKQTMIEHLTGVKSSKMNYYTELKKTIQELEKKNINLEIMNESLKSFNVNMDIDDMLKNVLEKLQRVYSVSRISLSLLEEGELILTNVYPLDSKFLQVGSKLPSDESLYWEATYQKRATLYSFPLKKEEVPYIERHTFEKLGMESVLALPLLSKERVLGVLSLGSKEFAAYSEDDLSFFQQFADQLAVCIENSRLYNAVLQGKKEWESTFNAVEDMLFLISEEEKILRFNQAVLNFFKVKPGEIIGRHYADILFRHPKSKGEELDFSQSQHARLVLEENRICEMNTYPVITDDNQLHGILLYIKDVTKRTHIEAQLMQSGKLAAIGEMAAGVAHELNSPLTAILGNAQLLLRQADQKDISYELLTDIRNCGDRCKHIIRNLLTFSRQDEYMFQECSLNQAVEQVLSLVKYQIERQHIQVTVTLASELPAFNGSMQQIEQTIINLLLNAKDVLLEEEKEEKCILIETKAIFKEGEEWVELTVSDNGKGIPPRLQTEIFHPFYTTKETDKGTGLGLSVSLGIAKAHGGMLTVTSEEGKGSCFTLLLPAKRRHT